MDRRGRGSYVTSAGAGPSVGKHILMAYLTPEEAAKVVTDVLARPGRDSRTARGTEKDVAGAYNQLFVQRANELSDGRTSLIIDPADGRIPPLTPEAKKRNAEAE